MGTCGSCLVEEHKEKIDLLITDMVMPGGLTGVEVADHISGERPNLPIIFSTGYSVNLFSDARRFRRDVNYLPKPYFSHELTSIVSSILAHPHGGEVGSLGDLGEGHRPQSIRPCSLQSRTKV